VFILCFILILTVTGRCDPVVSIPGLYRQDPGFECELEIGCFDRLFFVGYFMILSAS
jgi:hypothetical protein